MTTRVARFPGNLSGAGGRDHRTSWFVTLPLCVLLVGVIVVVVDKQRWSAAIVFAALPAVVALLSADLRAVATGLRSSLILPAVIAVVPLLNGFNLGVGGAYATGATILAALPWLLVLMYVGALGPVETAAFKRRARKLALPLAGIVLATAAAQAATGEIRHPVVQLTSVFSLYFLVGMVGFFLLACLYCSSAERIERLMWWCLVVNVVQVVVVLGQKVAPGAVSPLETLLRVRPTSGYVTGALGDAELTAETMVLMYAWALCLALWGRTSRRRLASGLLAGAYLIAAASLSIRSGILGVGGVTILVIAFSLVGTKRRASWGVVVALFGTLVLLFASSGLLRGLPAGVEARLTSGSTAGQLNGKDQGLANRQPIYVAAFRAAAHMPITGYGINHVAPVEAQAGPNVSWTSLHSIWLWSLLSAGFAGLAFTVLLFFRLLTCASRAWSRARSGVSAALLASVLFLLVDQSKVDAVRLPVYAFFLFAFFGMVASYWRIVQVETTAGSTAEEGT